MFTKIFINSVMLFMFIIPNTNTKRDVTDIKRKICTDLITPKNSINVQMLNGVPGHLNLKSCQSSGINPSRGHGRFWGKHKKIKMISYEALKWRYHTFVHHLIFWIHFMRLVKKKKRSNKSHNLVVDRFPPSLWWFEFCKLPLHVHIAALTHELHVWCCH